MAERIRKSKREKERALAVFERLRAAYPDVRCTLEYKSPLQLLVMTILAAQCTDARVNIVCRDLFRHYKKPEDFAEAAPGALEKAIHACGFFNQKARAIRESCAIIISEHNGQVPEEMEALLRLPGVGRKIANAVRGECFGKPGVIVDTHCKRVATRLGFTKRADPKHIERELMALWPEEVWTLYSHFMVFHGRAVCHARTPRCDACDVALLCPWPKRNKKDGNDA